MNGIITSGNYSFREVSLDGDTEIRGGNFVLCRITTNGHALTLSGGNRRGLYLDGVKQDSYVWRAMGPWATAAAIKELLASGGEDAITAFGIAIDVIKAGSTSMTQTQFTTAYAAAANGNLTYSASLYNRIKQALPVGWGWTDVRDWIRAQPKDRMMGLDTEIIEERS